MWIVIIIALILGMALGAYFIFFQAKARIMSYLEIFHKNERTLRTYQQWMRIRNKNKTVANYLKSLDIKIVAIYGMNYLGNNLQEELTMNGICVKYAIDRSFANIKANVPVISPDARFEKVDAIIVTAVYYFDEIEDMLSDKVDCPILSLEDIVFDE